MAITYLDYHLKNGYVQNWLVAGPEEVKVSDFTAFSQDKLEEEILKSNFNPDSGIDERTVDTLYIRKEKQKDEAQNYTWSYRRCAGDHFVDFSSNYPACKYLKAWAFVELETPESKELTFTLTANGPVDFWLNGQLIHRQEQYSKQTPLTTSFPVTPQAGKNQMLFRIENVGLRETSYVFALHIDGISDEESKLLIPVEMDSEYLDTRKTYEDIIEHAYLDRYVYGWFTGDVYNKNEPITVRFNQDLKVSKPYTIVYRLQSLHGDIFQEGRKDSDATTIYELAKNYPIISGPHYLELIPEAGLYYVKKVRVTRDDIFFVTRTQYSNKPYSMIHERRNEAITDASTRRGESIFTEIAKMVMGQWDKLNKKALQSTLDRINAREDGSVIELLGLTGLLLRYRKSPDFPKPLRSSIEECILNYKYWSDEPGSDIMDYQTESRQLLFHVLEILAGQIFMNRTFSNSKMTGKAHFDKGEQLTYKWIIDHGIYGWQDWDSPKGFEEELAGLSYLIDFANSYQISELASILMDKMLYILAINSFQGAFGSTHNHVDTASILSSRLEPTSGISRIMWGMGNFNDSLFGTVSLACMKKYDLANPLRNIAIHQEDGFWDREREGGLPSTNKPAVNKVTYRTHDYMLSSAQDYAPYTHGKEEHIWQATLGADAVVFVNHPACFSEDDAHTPNFWRGNQTLPRVAQWGDTLIGLYKIQDGDWMNFTHAYFPTAIFDAYKVEEHWAFAKKDKAYLAIYSSTPLEFNTTGQSAYRELRANAKDNVWICQMGQELLDGTFEDFQKKVKEANLQIDGMKVSLTTIRGDKLEFGAEEPFQLNGQVQPLSDFKHFENSYSITEYPSSVIDIGYKDQGIRLRFDE